MKFIKEGYSIVNVGDRKIALDQIFVRVIDEEVQYYSILAPVGTNVLEKLFDRLDTNGDLFLKFIDWYCLKYGPIKYPQVGKTYTKSPHGSDYIIATEENMHIPMYLNKYARMRSRDLMELFHQDRESKGISMLSLIRSYLSDMRDTVKIVDASGYILPDAMGLYTMFLDQPYIATRWPENDGFEEEIDSFIESRTSIVQFGKREPIT